MFSGIVEEVGRVEAFDPSSGHLDIHAKRVLSGEFGLRVSDSVSVSGACLTVVNFESSAFSVDVTPETQRATWFSQLKKGAHVNLERALRFGAVVGGHLVQGHVEGLGRITDIRHDGDAKLITVRSHSQIMRYIVEKGFVAVDGVSLTAFNWRPESFTFTLIPYTAIHTTLGVLKVGDAVNIETDQTGKYIERFVTQPLSFSERGASTQSPKDRHQSGA